MRCVTIGDVNLVPTLERYDHFLSLSTLLSTIFIPPMRPHYYKRLTDLLGLKRPVMEALIWYGGVEHQLTQKTIELNRVELATSLITNVT